MREDVENKLAETITSTMYKELPTVQELRRSTENMWRRIFSSNELMHGEPNAIRKQTEAVQKRVRAREGKGRTP